MVVDLCWFPMRTCCGDNVGAVRDKFSASLLLVVSDPLRSEQVASELSISSAPCQAVKRG